MNKRSGEGGKGGGVTREGLVGVGLRAVEIHWTETSGGECRVDWESDVRHCNSAASDVGTVLQTLTS